MRWQLYEMIPCEIVGYYYKTYLNANPFYTDMYTEHAPTKADTVTFTKTTVIGALQDHLNKAGKQLPKTGITTISWLPTVT